MVLIVVLDSPALESINPAEGWTHGGATLIVVGDNFFQGIEIGFDRTLVPTDVSVRLYNFMQFDRTLVS